MEIFIGIIVLIIIIILWNNFSENQRKEERRQTRIVEERRIKRENEERERLDEIKYEKLTVVFATIGENGKPEAIVKKIDNKYISIVRTAENPKPYVIGEVVKLEKKKITNWNWYDEEEFKEQLILHQKADLIKQKELDKQKIQDQHLDKFRIKYLFHMTHKENLQKILQNGLKSHNYARDNSLLQKNIADNEVNDRRTRAESIYNRSIHNYVPLYFNPKNPMLYVRKNIQNDIIILAIDRILLFEKNTVFTDGNAAANSTSFYKNTEDLKNLNWDCINAAYWNEIPDGKRLRCSEILIYPDIPTKAIQKIFCNNENTKTFVNSHLNNLPNIKTEINYNLYF